MFSIEYVAGFFDGEGCIYLNEERVKKTVGEKKYSYPELQLILGQSGTRGREVLAIIKDQFGFGKLREVKKTGPVNATLPAYMIQTSGRNALRVLKELEPYLFVKREKAKTAINFMEKYYTR